MNLADYESIGKIIIFVSIILKSEYSNNSMLLNFVVSKIAKVLNVSIEDLLK